MPGGRATEGMGASPRVLACARAAPRGGGDVTDQLIEQPTAPAVESVDELGPVDWLVVEFPGSRFTGEIAPALDALVDNGTIRVLDLVLVRKDEDGSLDFFELSARDESEIGGLRAHETERGRRLSEEDMPSLGAAIEQGSTAAVRVWENRWAAPFGSAVRRAGGQLVGPGRIPVQALLASVEAEDADENETDEGIADKEDE